MISSSHLSKLILFFIFLSIVTFKPVFSEDEPSDITVIPASAPKGLPPTTMEESPKEEEHGFSLRTSSVVPWAETPIGKGAQLVGSGAKFLGRGIAATVGGIGRLILPSSKDVGQKKKLTEADARQLLEYVREGMDNIRETGGDMEAFANNQMA